MEKSYRDRVTDFLKRLQPNIKAEDKYFQELPIGSMFWVPCAGDASRRIKSGHVGRVDTYAGNRKFTQGDWVPREQAQARVITLTDTHGLCPSCSKI